MSTLQLCVSQNEPKIITKRATGRAPRRAASR